MNNNKKKLIYTIILVVLIVALYIFFGPELLETDIEEYEPTGSSVSLVVGTPEEQEAVVDFSSFKKVTVKRVVDGDTFIYRENGNNVRVRMIGIDTPESVAPEETGKENTLEGKSVSDYVKDMLDGKTVYLEYDAEKTDKFDRELAYVYLEDGRRVEDILLSMGYAKTMTIQPNCKYAEHFVAIEQTAHDEKAGYWDGYFEEWKK